MDQAPTSIPQLVIRRVRHEMNGWIRALQQGSSALGDFSSRSSNELAYSSRVWQEALDEIEGILDKADELTFAQIDRLLELLPPDRAILRYHLERLTPVYEEVCLSARGDTADTFRQAEVAIDRGDFEIGLNILDHVSKNDPRFYPALMLKGVTLMRSSRGREESIRLFERSIQAAPLKAGDRYKMLALELLASTCQIADSPQMAIKTLRRTRSVGYEDPAIDYNIARHHAIIGQSTDAINALELAIQHRPMLFSLSLVDRDFTSIRRTIVEKLEEENERWGELAVAHLKEGRRIIRLAEDLKLDKRDRAVAKGKAALEEMNKMLDFGCYSVYKEILHHHLPRWLETVPAAIERNLNEIAQERLEQVREHNEELEKAFKHKRSIFLRVGIPLWGFFCALVFLIAVSKGSGMGAAVLSAGVMLLIGTIPFTVVNSLLRRSFEEKRISLDKVPDVRAEINQIQDFQKSMTVRLREIGVEVKPLDRKRQG
ncbi:MAG: hypothetical protein V2A56_04205 [bacterium]